MPTFLDTLNEEIAALEYALAKDPRYKKLATLREAQKLYLQDTTLSAQELPRSPGLTERERRASREMAPERRRVLEATEAFLASKFEPVPTREIFEKVVAIGGFTIGGRDPVNGLSAILSRSDKFIAHGRSGWTLGLSSPTVCISTACENQSDSEGPDSGELPGTPKANGAEPLSR